MRAAIWFSNKTKLHFSLGNEFEFCGSIPVHMGSRYSFVATVVDPLFERVPWRDFMTICCRSLHCCFNDIPRVCKQYRRLACSSDRSDWASFNWNSYCNFLHFSVCTQCESTDPTWILGRCVSACCRWDCLGTRGLQVTSLRRSLFPRLLIVLQNTEITNNNNNNNRIPIFIRYL